MANEIAEKIQEEQSDLVVQIEDALMITTDAAYATAAELGKAGAAMMKKIKEHHDPIIAAANKTHKLATAARNKLLNPVKDAVDKLRTACGGWLRKKEDERRKEQERLQAAERKRQEREKLARAEKLEKAGNVAAADAVLDMPTTEAAITVDAAPKVEGVSGRKTWTYEIEDEKMIPRTYLMVDTVKIGKIVTAMKGETDIPGVRAYQKSSAAFR